MIVLLLDDLILKLDHLLILVFVKGLDFANIVPLFNLNTSVIFLIEFNLYLLDLMINRHVLS